MKTEIEKIEEKISRLTAEYENSLKYIIDQAKEYQGHPDWFIGSNFAQYICRASENKVLIQSLKSELDELKWEAYKVEKSEGR